VPKLALVPPIAQPEPVENEVIKGADAAAAAADVKPDIAAKFAGLEEAVPPELLEEFGTELVGACICHGDELPPDGSAVLEEVARRAVPLDRRKPFDPVESRLGQLCGVAMGLEQDGDGDAALVAQAPPELRALWRHKLGEFAQALLEYAKLFEEPTDIEPDGPLNAATAANLYSSGTQIVTTPPSGPCRAHQIIADEQLDPATPEAWQRLLDLGYSLAEIR